MTRPAIRYHGGKWNLAPWIISHFPPHRTYTEAFGGGASVLLRKPRSYAEVYNDLNQQVVNLFRVIRDQGPALRDKIYNTPFARDEFELAYQHHDDPVEQARRLVVRTFMGFGSNAHNRLTGFRANSNRSGTTPAHDWANLPLAYEAIIKRFQGVVIENQDARKVISAQDSLQTLHYVDPPYVMSTRSDSGKDYSHEMTDNDHVQLAETLHNCQGFVILSGYPSELYDDLYADWLTIDKATFADGAKPRTERLWLNPRAAAHLPQASLLGAGE